LRGHTSDPIDADFYFQITDPATNWAIGARNLPVNIAPGQAQSFILGLTARTDVSPTEVSFNFMCDNAGPAPVFSGLNTHYFSASTDPVPDVIALANTVTGDGIVDLPLGNQFGFFSVASINLGSTATIAVAANATGASVSNVLVCETNPVTAASPPADAVTPPASGTETSLNHRC
jgi:hypothetical protein